MAFLTFMSASKHVLFALSVDPTARDAGKGGGSDLVSQATPFAVSCRLVAIHVPLLHKSSIVKPRETSRKCCRVPWLRSNSATDVVYIGEIVQCVAPQKLATC